MAKAKRNKLAAALGGGELPSPKRTAVPAAAAEAFAAGGRTSVRADGQAPDRKRVGRGLVELRGSGRTVRRLMVHLDPTLAERLELRAVRERVPMSELVSRAVAAELARVEGAA